MNITNSEEWLSELRVSLKTSRVWRTLRNHIAELRQFEVSENNDWNNAYFQAARKEVRDIIHRSIQARVWIVD